jgi:hypothetical protein
VILVRIRRHDHRNDLPQEVIALQDLYAFVGSAHWQNILRARFIVFEASSCEVPDLARAECKASRAERGNPLGTNGLYEVPFFE